MTKKNCAADFLMENKIKMMYFIISYMFGAPEIEHLMVGKRAVHHLKYTVFFK